jgi:pyridoxamine 5'-phosphate oxidase
VDDALRSAIAGLSREHSDEGLDLADLHADPIRQFEVWMSDAIAAGFVMPNAMTLATVGPDGQPSARVTLLKGVDDTGFIFFSNYESRKGTELIDNPKAALVFYWEGLGRQVRVEGVVERLSAEESDAYFQTRSLGSRVGAWASPQSRVLADRAELDQLVFEITERFGDGDIPLPPHWGGFRLLPERIEFWKGRRSRLHDRFRYTRTTDGWLIERLAP